MATLTRNRSLQCIEKQCIEAFERVQHEPKGTAGFAYALNRYRMLLKQVRHKKHCPEWTPGLKRKLRLDRVKRAFDKSPVTTPPPASQPASRNIFLDDSH